MPKNKFQDAVFTIIMGYCKKIYVKEMLANHDIM